MQAEIEKPAYDLALVDLTFTPPLATLDWETYGQATLLVAVANEGRESVSDVQVVARLLAESTAGQAPLRIESTQPLEALAPGDVRVLHFRPLAQLPLRQSYRLEVEIVPVEGEDNTDNNFRQVEITIGTGR